MNPHDDLPRRFLAYSPRRAVPWGGGDVALVLVAYILLLGAAVGCVRGLLGKEISGELGRPAAGNLEHPIVQLMREALHGGAARDGGNAWILLLGFVAAVVIAPIVEEFFFRVLLQGWLEARERRWRRRAAPWLRRITPRAAAPVVLVALLFALMHVRAPTPLYHPQYLVGLVLGNQIAGLLTVALAVGWLRVRVGATAADFGWEPRKLAADLGLGLRAAAIVVPLVLAFQWAVGSLLTYLRLSSAVPDPIPLFFFALVLGTLYYRTHRIAPSVVLHLSLNLTSVLLLLLGMAG
jgi:membrane protease YdiL (CAAX protease family)